MTGYEGYVYAIHDPQTLLVKIGASIHVEKRIKELGRKEHGLRLLKKWESNYLFDDERCVQRLLRLRGLHYSHEWFRLCAEDLKLIDEYFLLTPYVPTPRQYKAPIAEIIIKCPKCEYQWASRKNQPRQCPKCKKRLDWKVCDYVLPDKGEVDIGEKDESN